MTIKYNVTGAKRKELVLTIASWLGCEAKYKGAPSFAYEVDYFTIDKDGTLIFDDRADSEVIERLLEMLYDNGFEAESLPKADEEETSEVEITGLAIDVPLADFTENALKNVHALVTAKGNLIKKAFDVDELPVYEIDDFLDFASAYKEHVTFVVELFQRFCFRFRKEFAIIHDVMLGNLF